jgi:flagellar biosynthesis/type III secretory pathway ATPase
VLSRQLGAAGHYPAIDVLGSISRVASHVALPEHLKAAAKMREALASYQQSEDLISLGAYVSGANPKLDASIRCRERMLNFLRQRPDEATPLAATLGALNEIAAAL